MDTPSLSVIIPTLDEENNLKALLNCLNNQQDVNLDVIVADGGSQDGSLGVCHHFQQNQQHGLTLTLVETHAGRAKQMNRAVKQAQSEYLLFLHADTQIEDTHVLIRGLSHLQQCHQQSNSDHTAGHFKLNFLRQQSDHQQAYYFYECKTSLNRQDTINGDQGIMISRGFFEHLGGFNESLPYMEDARLARKVFQSGDWVTLPGYVSTSARRFETEGLKQRQTLNAILCNFVHIGFWDFFQHAADAYRQQDKTRNLQLRPFLRTIHHLVSSKGLIKACRYWYLTGAYVVSNTWQLFYLKDCNNNFRQQRLPGSGPKPWLKFYDRWLNPVLTSPPGNFIAAILTLIWFYALLLSGDSQGADP